MSARKAAVDRVMALISVRAPIFQPGSLLAAQSGLRMLLEGAVVLRNKTGPVLLRAPLESGGYIEYWLGGEGGPRLAAVGDGEADSSLLRANFPDVLGPDLIEEPFLSAHLEQHTFLAGVFSDAVAPSRFDDADWECTDIVAKSQRWQWCVPTCMSMLSPRICGEPCPPEIFAKLWGQGADAFDAATQYADFRRVCVTLGLNEQIPFTGGFVDLSWTMLQAAKRPMLVALSGGHAQICAGTCQTSEVTPGKFARGIKVHNPGSGSGWISLPVAAMFSFLAPGPQCPRPL
jgi:hypothetical protein